MALVFTRLLNDLQCLALHQIPIDLGTQTWTGRRLHHAAGIHFDVVHQSVLERTAARKDFVVVAVRDRHRDVQVGDVVERVTAVVDFALHLEALGHVRDANHRCDTTANGDVAAQHVRRTLIDPLGHAVEAARRELGIDHRDVELLLQLLVVVDVLFGERVLVPEVVEFFDRAAHAQRVLVAVRPHGVEHEHHLVTDGLAHRLTDLDIALRLGVRMQLVGRPTLLFERQCFLRELLLRRPPVRARIRRYLVFARAEQLMDRHVRGLAGDVPQRDVNRADHRQVNAAMQRPHLVPQTAGLQRILADQHALHAHELLGADVAARQERVTRNALVGLDGHDAEFRLGGKLDRRRLPRLNFPVDERALDVRDLHGFPTAPCLTSTGCIQSTLDPTESTGNHPARLTKLLSDQPNSLEDSTN